MIVREDRCGNCGRQARAERSGIGRHRIERWHCDGPDCGYSWKPFPKFPANEWTGREILGTSHAAGYPE